MYDPHWFYAWRWDDAQRKWQMLRYRRNNTHPEAYGDYQFHKTWWTTPGQFPREMYGPTSWVYMAIYQEKDGKLVADDQSTAELVRVG